MSLLQIQAVSKRRGFGNRAVSVLRGASLEVARGEIVLLRAPSGSGKTTLLGLAAGLLLPDDGTVKVDGESLPEMSAVARRELRSRKIGFVFQRSNLFASLTVRQNVFLMAGLAGMSERAAAAEVATLLEHLGMSALAGRFPAELSGGEEQRVAVVRALVHRPALVLADEPTGNLDRASGQAVADALVDITRSRHSAVVIATHDARLAPIATRHLTIRDGYVEPLE